MAENMRHSSPASPSSTCSVFGGIKITRQCEGSRVLRKAAMMSARPAVQHIVIAIHLASCKPSEVGVAEGTVRVQQQQSPPAREVTLHAGERVSGSSGGDVRRHDFNGENITQILEDWRVFSPAKLTDMIHAVSRQSGMEIWLDPGIADLEIRGRFNVADAMVSLDLIARTTGTRMIELPFDQYLLVR